MIGGGGVAVDVAISARRLGAKRVTMACLESRETMPAAPEEIAQALEEGVELLASWGPQRLVTSTGRVSGMELVRCTSPFDVEGRFNPSFDTDTTVTVDADCVLLAIGQVPDLRFAEGLVQMDGTRIVVTEQGATSLPNAFAGGDVVTGPASVIEAIAAGRRAAMAIDRHLGGHVAVAGDDHKVESSPLIKIRTAAFPRLREHRRSPLCCQRGDIETEDVGVLDLASAEEEAKRCFNCGVSP